MTGILNIQLAPILGNKEANLRKVEFYIKKNCDKKLDLVVLPEFFSTGICHKSFLEEPEDENGGQTIQTICELAKRFNTNIVAGTVIEKTQDKLYNTCFVINRDGEIIDKYRKIHLYNYMGGTEGDRITAGDKLVVTKLDFGTIGLGICYDIRYPQMIRKLVQMGAQMIVLPTAWVVPTDLYNNQTELNYAQDMWVSMLRTRAYDNLVYIVTSNQTKQINDNVSAIGNSLIIAPTTQVIQNIKDKQDALYSDIDLELIKYYKSIYPITEIE